jgi:hypothetical protein
MTTGFKSFAEHDFWCNRPDSTRGAIYASRSRVMRRIQEKVNEFKLEF